MAWNRYGYNTDNLTTVATPSGIRYSVDTNAAPKFQGMLNDLASQGYNFAGQENNSGYNARANRSNPSVPSKHASGQAIDINTYTGPQGQVNAWKSHVTDLPANTPDLAAKWGITWGNNFRNADPMHFETNRTPVIPGVGTRAMYGNAADASDWAAQRQQAVWNNALHPPSLLDNIASTVAVPFNAAQNALGSAYNSMFGSPPTSAPTQVASAPTVPPANVGAVAPAPQRPTSYSPLNGAPPIGQVTSSSLPALPSQMPARPPSPTQLTVGTQVADNSPTPPTSYAEGTLGHMLNRPNTPVLGTPAPSMPMSRVTAMPQSAPAFAPAPQAPPSLPVSALSPPAPLAPTVPSTAAAPPPTPSLPSLSPSAPALNGQTTTGLLASNAGLPGLSAMMQGNRPALTADNFAASLQPPSVPGTNLPVGDPANPVNSAPVAPPSTFSKMVPTGSDLKTGLVGAKLGMAAGPMGAAAGFAIPVLGGMANRLGYGLNSSFFGGPTPNPGASPATQSDVVAHAAPSVLAQVNRMGYGALDPNSGYHYGYSPFGNGIAMVNNNDSEAHQIAATGPGLLGAFGFGGPASAPSIAAQAAAAHLAAANDAANSAAAAQGSVNQGNGGSIGDNGSNGGKNGRGRNKTDNGNN